MAKNPVLRSIVAPFAAVLLDEIGAVGVDAQVGWPDEPIFGKPPLQLTPIPSTHPVIVALVDVAGIL